jgi:hypothetical protein
VSGIWDILGIEPTADERSIKRAYARGLKQTRAEDDPEGFQALNDAYQAALRQRQYMLEDQSEVETEAAPPADTQAGMEPAPAAVREAVNVTAPDAASPSSAAMHEAALRQAWHDAGVLWQQYLATATVSPRLKLEKVLRSDELLNLLCREAFELIALRHCADAGCEEELRAAVVEHFGWEQDGQHMQQLDGQAVYDALGRYRSDMAYGHLLKTSQSGSPDAAHIARAARKLLAARPPRFALATMHAPFTRAMRDLVATIRWRTPEILRYRINPDVFNWWELHVQQKRYFLQTALYSVIGGMALYLLLAAMFGIRILEGESVALPLLAASMASVIAAVAYLTLKPPARLQGSIQAWRDALHRGLQTKRSYLLIKYGWLAAFLLLSQLLFIPAPGMLLGIALSAGLLVCAALGLIAVSPNLLTRGYVIIAVVSILLGFGLHFAFPSYSWVAMLSAGACLQILAINGDERLADIQALYGTNMLSRLQTGWLVTLGMLAYCATVGLLPPVALAMLAWTWLVAGVVLTNFSSISGVAFWMAFIVAKGIASSADEKLAWPAPELPVFAPLLILTIFFMLSTMFKAAATPGYSRS